MTFENHIENMRGVWSKWNVEDEEIKQRFHKARDTSIMLSLYLRYDPIEDPPYLIQAVKWKMEHYSTWEELLQHDEALSIELALWYALKQTPIPTKDDVLKALDGIEEKKIVTFSALTMPNKSRFVASFENELIDKLFPHKNEGVGIKDIVLNNGKTVGKINIGKPFESMDIFVYISLICSLDNTTEDGKFYYIPKDAFCRKFFGIKNDQSPITQQRKQLIENAIDRLRSAYFLKVSITKEHGIKQLESLATALTNEPYLPLYGKDFEGYEQGVKIGDRVIPAWLIPVDTRLPIKQLGTEFKRWYELTESIMPREGTNIDIDTANLFSHIYRKFVTTWFPSMVDNAKTIIIEELFKPKEPEANETKEQRDKRMRQNRQNKVKFIGKVVEGLKQWQRDGLCTFAVGVKHSNGKYTYFTKGKPNNLLTYKGKIERVMIVDVPRNNETHRQITE